MLYAGANSITKHSRPRYTTKTQVHITRHSPHTITRPTSHRQAPKPRAAISPGTTPRTRQKDLRRNNVSHHNNQCLVGNRASNRLQLNRRGPNIRNHHPKPSTIDQTSRRAHHQANKTTPNRRSHIGTSLSNKSASRHRNPTHPIKRIDPGNRYNDHTKMTIRSSVISHSQSPVNKPLVNVNQHYDRRRNPNRSYHARSRPTALPRF